MKYGNLQLNKWSTVIAAIILFSSWSLHQAMADEFEAGTEQDNMQAGGDGAKLFGWHVFNAGTADKIDVNVTNSGKLTLDHGPASTNNWSTHLSGPFVYKIVDGDFDVEIEVSDNSDQNAEGTALMVKHPSGLNHIQVKHVFSGFQGAATLLNEFQNTVNGSSSTTVAPYVPFLRIQRTGAAFFLYDKPSAGSAWTLRRTLSRSDWGTSLQVGIAFQSANTSNTFVSQVEYFRGLEGAVAPVDHFLCYEAKPPAREPKFTPRSVNLGDQFGNSEKFVTGPSFVCNPVDKNGEGIVNPDIHLTCYEVADVKGAPKFLQREVSVDNQFGDGQTLLIKPPKILCVPSTKEVIAIDG